MASKTDNKTSECDMRPIVKIILLLFLLLAGCASLNTLNKAVDRGSVTKVTALLDAGADVNELQPLYGTPLQIAVKNGDTQMAKLLIERGADVKQTFYVNHSSESILGLAVSKMDSEMVQLLIGAGADINKSSFLHISILARFAGEGDLDTVRFLLANGANIKLGYPVRLAARGNHLEVARFLIDKGANVNCPPKYGLYGLSTIEQAVISESNDMVSLILSVGADTHCRGSLDLALSSGNKNIYQILLDAGATP